MPDITKCSNVRCPNKMLCKRFICSPSSFQSYQEFEFILIDHRFSCENKIDVK